MSYGVPDEDCVRYAATTRNVIRHTVECPSGGTNLLSSYETPFLGRRRQSRDYYEDGASRSLLRAAGASWLAMEKMLRWYECQGATVATIVQRAAPVLAARVL